MNKSALSLLLTLLLAIAAGCDGGNSKSARESGKSLAEQKKTLDIVTVAHLPIADCAQLYVGIEKGFFTEQGLMIERSNLASGVKILEALVTGSVDIGFSAVAPLILANARGLELVSISGGSAEDKMHAEHAVVVAKDSPIQSPSDLLGKTIGIVAFRSIDEPFVKEWLEIKGVDVKGVNFYEIRFPQMEPTLLSGQVQAVAMIEPFVTAARLNGKTRVLGNHFTEVQSFTEISSYNARKKWVDENEELISRFRAAFDKATDYTNDHPMEVKGIIAKYTKIAPELASEMGLPLFRKRLSKDRLLAVMELMRKWGIIEEPVDGTSLISQ